MFSVFRLVCFSFCLFLTLPLRSEEATASLDHFLDGLDTFQAKFQQSLRNAKGDIVERSSGMLYMQNPGKFHWAYEQPYAQSIITNGSTIWIYDEDLEQVTIKNISGEIDNTPAAILSGTENLSNHFEIIDKGKVEGIYIIELNPIDPENQFHSIQLGFYGRFLNLMVMFDRLGQITRVNFSETKRNESLASELFNFVPPEGTDVVDGREPSIDGL